MDDFLAIVLVVLGAIGLAFFASLIGGTFVWLIWPVVAKAFPALVSGGYLSSSLSWWDSVCLTWLFGLLIKSTNTNNTKKD